MDLPYSATFTLSEQDLIEAGRAFQLRSMKELKFMKVLVGMAVCSAILAWVLSGQEQFLLLLAIILIGSLGLLAFLIFLTWWLVIPADSRRRFKEAVALREEIEIEFDESVFTLSTHRSNARFEWDEFYRCHEAARCFLLYQNAQLYHVIPKRVLNDRQANFLRRCIAGMDV